MGIGLTEEHQELASSVRGLAERHISREIVRGAIGSPQRPGFWEHLRDLLGLHLPERYGGQGFSLLEQAVAVEELGRALAPGPYVPTVMASAVLAATTDAAEELLPGLADGGRTGALGL